jgi:hypothetical protein
MSKRAFPAAFEEYKKARTLIDSLITTRAGLEVLGSEASSAQQIELISVQERIQSARAAAIDYAAFMAKVSEEGENSQLFTNADQNFIEKVTGTKLCPRAWIVPEDTKVFPSDTLKQRLEDIGNVVSIYKESGRRFILNEFLLDILSRKEFRNALGIYTEYEFSVSALSDTAEKFQLSGVADYTIGRSEKSRRLFGKDPPKELHLIAAEAKREWPNESYWQCVAQTAALYKSRKDAGKTVCKVWGFLSNAALWTFVHIDEEGQLHATTTPLTLHIGTYDESKILAIYRHIYYIVKAAFDASPPPSPEESERQRSRQGQANNQQLSHL